MAAAGTTKNSVAQMFMRPPTHSPSIRLWMMAATAPTAKPAPGPKAKPHTMAGMSEGS